MIATVKYKEYMSQENLTAEQDEALDTATKLLWGSFGMAQRNVDLHSLKAVIAQVVAPMPHYSERRLPQVSVVTSQTMGASILPYYIDEAQNPPVTYVVTTKENTRGKTDVNSVLGGHIDHDKHMTEDGTLSTTRGESVTEGALREFSEELIDDNGKAVLDIDASRLSKIGETTHYHIRGEDTHIHTHRFALALTRDEFETVVKHSNNMALDNAYRAAVLNHTKGEIAGINIADINEVVAIEPSSCKYPNMPGNAKDLQEMLMQHQVVPGNVKISAVSAQPVR